MLTDLDGEPAFSLTALFESKVADLSAAFGVGVQMRFYHVNDTSSAVQAVAQLLADNVEVAISTVHTDSTTVVRYALRDRGDPPLLIAFCEASQAMAADGDSFLVSLYSEEARGAANLRAAEAEGFHRLVYITDRTAAGGRIPVGVRCHVHTARGTCVTAVHDLSRRTSTRDTLLPDDGFEVAVVDVQEMAAVHRVLHHLRAWGRRRRYTVLFNGDGLLEDMFAQDMAPLLDNALVVTPLCPPELRVRYGVGGCINVAHGLDALELAVRAAQSVADLRAVRPINSVASAIAFTGATGPVQFVGPYRVSQTFMVSTVDSGAATLQVVGRVAGAPGAVYDRTSRALWRGRARQGPAIGYTVRLVIMDDFLSRLWFRGCQRAIDEYNAVANGTSAGAVPLRDRRFVLQRLTKETLDQYDPLAIGSLGPTTTDGATQIDPVVERYIGQPLISLATAAEFSNKREHPYFLRMVPPDDRQTAFLAAVLHHYGWLPVCVVHTIEDYGVGLGTALYDLIATSNATIHQLTNLSVPRVLAVLAEVRVQECRTVVVTATLAKLGLIMGAAVRNGMFLRRNWVLPDTGSELPFTGILYSFGSSKAEQPTEWLLYAYARDALYTYAHGIAAVLAASHNPYQGDRLRDAMAGADFEGLTGRVRFDQVTGDRLGVYYLVNVLPSGQKHLVLRQQDTASSLTRATRSTLVEMDTIVYTGNTTGFSSKVRPEHHHLPHAIPPLLVPSFPGMY